MSAGGESHDGRLRDGSGIGPQDPLSALDVMLVPHTEGGTPGRVAIHPPEKRREYALHGRDDLITALVADLPPSATDTRPAPLGPGHVHILHGLGGCGKTETALEVARIADEAGLDVWWLNAGGRAILSGGMREIALRLGGSPASVREAWNGRASGIELVWKLLDEHRHWLLVLDNADWPEYLAADGPTPADGVGWLRRPATAQGMVIVTSKTGDEDTWGRWTTRHRVRQLEPVDGAAILTDYLRAGDHDGKSGDEDVEHDEDREAALRLSERLGGLPLALRTAGAYLRDVKSGPVWRGGASPRSVDSYLRAIDEYFHRRSDGGPDDTAEGELGKIITQVEQICALSLDRLAERGQEAARPLFILLAMFAASPIPYGALLSPQILSASGLFPDSLAEARIRQLIEGLDSLALIDLEQREPYHETYGYVLTVHALMRNVAHVALQMKHHALAYRRLMIDLLLDAAEDLDPDDPDEWVGWIVLAPHCGEPIQDYLRWAAEHGHTTPDDLQGALRIIRKAARFLLARGLPRQTEEYVRECLRYIPTDMRGDPLVLAVRHEFGRSFLDQGRFDLAEAELTAVLKERTTRLGKDSVDTLSTEHKLARVREGQRRWTEAENMFRPILAAEQRRNPGHPDTFIVHHSLARALYQQGRLTEAQEEISAVLHDWHRWQDLHSSPHPHPEELFARTTQARIMVALKDYEGGEFVFRQLAEDYEEYGWSNRPEYARVRQALAEVLLKLGRSDEARELLWSVEESVLSLWGAEHPETVHVRRLLAQATLP